MKKYLAFALAAILLIGCCSCGKTQTGANKDGEPVTITWLMWGDKQTDQESVNKKLDEISVPAINAKLDIQYIDAGSYGERMKMNMASRTDSYDMCFVGFNNEYIDAAKKGGLYDITELLKNHKKLYDSIPQYEWDKCLINGEIYAVPNVQVGASAAALCVKKDLADEYGLDLTKIKTLEEIEPFLKWVKENHPEVYPYRTSNVTGFKGDRPDLDTYNGVCVEEVNGKLVAKPDYEYDAQKTKYKLIRDWYLKGYIRKDNATATDDSQDYNAGKFACWELAYKPGVEAEIYTSKGYEAYCIQITEAVTRSSGGTGTMIGINANSKNVEKAMDMIELIQTNEEFYNLICFGIEGKHYKVVDERIVQDKNSGYMPTQTWRFGNQFNARLIEGQPDGVWEATKKFNDEARVSPLNGFVFDTTPVRTEIAQLSTITSKYSGLEKGVLDVDKSYAAMVAEKKKSGMDKVVAEVQKQVDEFVKNKK